MKFYPLCRTPFWIYNCSIGGRTSLTTILVVNSDWPRRHWLNSDWPNWRSGQADVIFRRGWKKKRLYTAGYSDCSIKGAVRRKIFYFILILFRSTFHMRKNSVLTKSISHHVPEIFRFLHNANEMPYDVIYSTQTK